MIQCSDVGSNNNEKSQVSQVHKMKQKVNNSVSFYKVSSTSEKIIITNSEKPILLISKFRV